MPPPKIFALWFTGLPCSGKTTLASALQKELRARGLETEWLDGDELRKKISGDLGFSKEDRQKHTLRVGELALRLQESGKAVLVSLISPYRETRQKAQNSLTDPLEIYVYCPLEICEKRDVKGMYRLAREGKIAHFTGVSDPYEEPLSPWLTVRTEQGDGASGVRQILEKLSSQGYF